MDKMTEQKRKEQIAAMSEDQLLHLHQKCMRDIELSWKVVAERLDERAGDERTGEQAYLSAWARSKFFYAKAFHCDADRFAAKAGGVPVPRSGER
jgi:hypothetical protein